MDEQHILTASENRMRAGGVGKAAIAAFRGALQRVIAGADGMIPEKDIEPAADIPKLEDISGRGDPTLLSQLCVIKLNGGLGTGMGLDRAKSLMVVKGGENFLDFIARQILHLRKEANAPGLRFLLMNSFSTREDTLSYLRKYPDLETGGDIDFLQSKVPKLDARNLEPISWPENPELEWCPPGHGDIYPSLMEGGLADRLLGEGVKYLFVSNSDNLGATVDPALLSYFASSGFSFLMEVAERTGADRKGGHLARRLSDGRLLLRESAQCPAADSEAFQDITRHRYFNTNNLWIRLDHVKDMVTRQGGALPLPLIKNVKTVDPRKSDSPKVIQLESAMGAAIECFEKTGAVQVPRSRFAPVKTVSDLLALRSDAYEVTPDHRLVLAPERNNVPPVLDLDGKHYKLVDALDTCFPEGVPSLRECVSMAVEGKVIFSKGVKIRGDVKLRAASDGATLPPGDYDGEVVAGEELKK